MTELVGRVAELAVAESALAAAAAGSSRLLLVVGEPGIGKTRLAEEIARRSASVGAGVLWGRAWESGGAPPLWPWVQVLRGAQALPNAGSVLPRLRGRTRAAIAELVDLPPGADEDGGGAGSRFALLDAVADLLHALSMQTPLLLVLEDLHVADPSSIEMLRFLTSARPDARLLLVATLRPSPGDPVTTSLGDAVLLPLGGLSLEQTRALARAQAPWLTDDIADLIAAATAGNPLFVHELVRSTAADGAQAVGSVARLGLRQAVARRLSTASPELRHVLQVASVLGRSVPLSLLSQLAQTTQLRPLLDAAVRDGLLQHESADVWIFTHDVLRSTLYDDLDRTERERLHAVAGRLLESQDETDLVAHHFAHGGEQVRDEAVRWLRRAGDAALGRFAYETAEARLETALALVAHEDRESRCDVLVALGAAQSRAGLSRGRQTLLVAADVARDLRDGDRLASALVALTGAVVVSVYVREDELIARLEHALDELPPRDPALHAQLLAGLVYLLSGAEDRSRRDHAIGASLELAAQAGDDWTTAGVLRAAALSVFYERRPEHPAWTEQLFEASQRLRRSRRGSGLLRARELENVARRLRTMHLLERGDVVGFEQEAAVIEALAEQLGQPRHVFAAECVRAARDGMAGRLEDMERRFARLFAVCPGEPLASIAELVGRGWALFELDRLREMRDLVGTLSAAMPTLVGLKLLLALAALEEGAPEQARAALAPVAAHLDGLRRDAQWQSFVATTAWVARDVGDAATTTRCYELLLPHRDEHVVVSFGQASCYLGSVELFLGMASRSAAHFERALDQHRRVGAPVWTARTLHELARLESDERRAEQLVEEALAALRGLPAHKLRRELQAQRETIPGGALVMRRSGDVWTLELGRRSVRVAHVKGLDHLCRLVSAPGVDIDAAHLANGDPVETLSRQPVLDDRARRDYQERVRVLKRALDEADRAGDARASAEARAELDAVAAELRRATGLAGRARVFHAPDERARIAVTKAVRRAIGRVAEQDADIAGHLSRTVSTGSVCSYRP